MDKIKQKNLRQARRHGRVRVKISGTASRPRLSVFRSNTGLFLQLIDDTVGKTLASASSREIKSQGKKLEISHELGKLIATKAKDKNISTIVFDRGSYKYHGRVKAVAEGARSNGLQF
jgi:large subunit ribosomal protein L18